MTTYLVYAAIAILVLVAAWIIGHDAWLDAEATARLDALDRARAAWRHRLTQFRAQRAALLTNPAIDHAERQRQLDELFARSFSPQERIRVETLDRIAAGTGGH